MKLYLVENGLFHRCTYFGKGNNKFHAKYYAKDQLYKCNWCSISFPSILALPFEIFKNDKAIFIGSKKIFSRLNNQKYKILEL